MPESGGTGEMEDPNDGGTTTPAQTDPSTLPETLTIAYLGSPRTEFTMSVGDEPIPLTVSGGSGTTISTAPAWQVPTKGTVCCRSRATSSRVSW